MADRSYIVTTLRDLVRHFSGWRLPVVVVIVVGLAAAPHLDAAVASVALVAAGLGVLVLIGVGDRRSRRLSESTAAVTTPVPSRSQAASPSIPVAGSVIDGPLVTVVVTSHNDGRYIGEAVASVRAQTWGPLECVVVDDGSTDRSMDLAMDAADGDGRFRFLELASAGGVAGARNLALSHARGAFITFLDADDVLFASSIEDRVSGFVERSVGLPWMAGTYCDWVGVEEAADVPPVGRPPMDRPRLTWLGALDGAPVINSAPMLRTDVIRSLGGYRESAAEDADLWNRLLRAGWALEPVRSTGVAYRQKQVSRFRRSSVAHAEVMVTIASSNRAPIGSIPSGPHPFTDGAHVYESDLAVVRRLLMSLTTAVGAGDDAGAAELETDIDRRWEPWMAVALDVVRVIGDAATRHESYELHGRAERAEILRDGVMARLTGLPQPDVFDLPISDARTTETGVTVLEERVRIEVGPERIADAVSGAVVMMPAVEYHVEELAVLASELESRGRRTVFLISDRRWEDARRALRRVDRPVYACPEPGEWVASAAAHVTLNDWGERYRDVVVAAKAHAVPTFGKVEGVQDFDDADVHWDRHAYETVDHVLCQGRNDAEAIRNESCHVVGSSRLERIWNAPPRRHAGDLVAVNLNFTYAVLEDEREDWLGAVRHACADAGLPIAVSLHPQERPRPGDADITADPMRHLLTRASVLVSRFSTVPFEAMARGVPFVYFNPHGEQVPTFQTPDGAFEIARSPGELGAALVEAGKWVNDYRSRCEPFFTRQIDIAADRSSERRAADVIESVIGPV